MQRLGCGRGCAEELEHVRRRDDDVMARRGRRCEQEGWVAAPGLGGAGDGSVGGVLGTRASAKATLKGAGAARLRRIVAAASSVGEEERGSRRALMDKGKSDGTDG